MKKKKIEDFIVNKTDRVDDTPYIYVRLEGDGRLNIGSSRQEKRYSSKTKPQIEQWLDCSFIEENIPDIPLHNYLKNNKKWISSIHSREVYENKSIEEFYEEYLNYYGYIMNGNYEKTEKFKLRSIQIKGNEFLVEFLNDNLGYNNKKALFECATGYGKTGVIYNALKETGCPLTIIITNRILVQDAWINDFKKFGYDKMGFFLKTTEKNENYGDEKTAVQKIILVPNKKNGLLNNIDTTNALYIIDEAHMGGNSEQMQEKIEDNCTIFVTATGNKLKSYADFSYHWDLIDAIDALENGTLDPTKFILPNFNIIPQMSDIDFSKMNHPDQNNRIEAIYNDIIKRNGLKNCIIKCQGYCINGYKMAQKLITMTGIDTIYCSEDGQKSHSFYRSQSDRTINGKQAIDMFNEDCKKDKNIPHILVTNYQGLESYNYHDISNIFYLSDTGSYDSFFQTYGRLTREKKNTHETTANFFLYCPEIAFYEQMDDYVRNASKNRGMGYNIAYLNTLLKKFQIFNENGVLTTMTAENVLHKISTNGHVTRCVGIKGNNDMELIRQLFASNHSTKLITNGGTRTKIKPTDDNKKDDFSTPTHYTNDGSDTVTPNNDMDSRNKFENFISYLCYYIVMSQWYSENPEKVDHRHKDAYDEFVYPTNRQELVDMKIKGIMKDDNALLYFKRTVSNTIHYQKVRELFQKLSDDTMELIIRKIVASKNKNPLDMDYLCITPIETRLVPNGRMDGEIFDQTVGKLLFNENFSKKDKYILVRTGVETALIMFYKGYKNLIYYTDISAEKFLFDLHNIPCNFVETQQKDSEEGSDTHKEDWDITFKHIIEKNNYNTMKIIANPPYNINKSKVYPKFIESMLNNFDEAVVICPDALKNMSVVKNKIVYYDEHVDKNIFKDASIDVSIFHLRNDYNSPITKTPNGEINFQEKRDALQEKRDALLSSIEKIGKRTLRNLYIEPKEEWFNKYTPTKESLNQSFKDYELKEDAPIFCLLCTGRKDDGGRFPIIMPGGSSKVQSGAIKMENKNITLLLENNDFVKIFNELNGDNIWPLRYGLNIPIPNDLNDERLMDENYIHELYLPALEIIQNYTNNGK
jgi:superfamily II DNA or RNA helicase